MQRKHFDPTPYHLLPSDPQANRALRRPNMIVLVFLAFFTLGMLITGLLLPHAGAFVPLRSPFPLP